MAASTSDRVRDFFDKRSESFHRIYASKSFVERQMNRVLRRAIYARTAVLVDEVARLEGPTLLDVGSGTGVNTFAAISNGATSALGLDLATSMVEMARKGASAAGLAHLCRFEQGDFSVWPETASYDVVTALGVFDYVRDAESFFRKMCRLAAKSVVASFPGTGIRGRLRRMRYGVRGCPLFLFEEADVRGWAAAEQCGGVTVPFRDSSGFVVLARR